MIAELPSIKLLGTSITNASEEVVLEYIFKRLQNKDKKFYIVTPNPEILMRASHSKEYQAILNDATVSLPDGIGVLISGRMTGKHIIGRITGTDLMEKICFEASKKALSIGLLGGRDGVAEKTAECLREKYPGLIVSFIGEEWNGEAKSHIDILFVAFGAPKQEEWIAKNLSKIDVTCAMGVGGAFDFISGKVRRAPRVVRRIGLEWAFRLVRQPWRAKRQLALPQFVYEVLKEKLATRN